MWIFSCIFTLAIVFLLRRYFDPKKRILSRIPGPKGIPFLGNALQIDPINIHRDLLSLKETYGEIFKLDFAGDQVVVLNSHAAIYEALVTKSKEYAGRVTDTFRTKYADAHQSIFFRDFDNEFVKIKKYLRSAVKMYDDNSEKVVHRSNAEIQCCMNKFSVYNEQPFDPNKDIYKTLVNIITELLASNRFEDDDSELNDIIEYQRGFSEALSAGVGEELDMFPWLRYFGNQTFKKMQFSVTMRNRIIGGWVEEHKKSFNRDTIRDLIDALLRAREDGDATFSDFRIIILVDDMLGAGILTTQVVVSAFLQLMILHPEIQTRLQHEVDSVVGASRAPSIEDRDAMPVLQANIHEILRYVSHIPIAVPHKTTTDTSVGGYDIPKSTQIWINLFALHHDENIFDEPWSYKPERWLDDSDQLVSIEERNKTFPFGAGRRVCAAEQFARTRVFLFLANILQRFTIVQPEDAEPSSADPRDYTLGLVLNPGQFTIKAIPR
ncbi:unnamed protein product [Owenia fusiformis]|uniref:Uncharacterized protein n=1 Tax=Owenia fusiformis TaxID=6347 RepID=A0A8J1TCK0_OWEFU|nr:unnamed protein product [Owenia fusiformis]